MQASCLIILIGRSYCNATTFEHTFVSAKLAPDTGERCDTDMCVLPSSEAESRLENGFCRTKAKPALHESIQSLQTTNPVPVPSPSPNPNPI